MTPERDFLTSVTDAETALVAGLELRPLSLPLELARMRGSWRGNPALLSARAYHGPRTAYARFVELSGTDLAIGNVLCLGVPERPLPILGADLVLLGKDTVVAVADLSPVPGAPHSGAFEALAGSEAARALPRAEPPAWAKSWLSEAALVTRAPVQLTAVIAGAVAGYARRYLELCAASAPDDDRRAQVLSAQASYARAHVEDDRGLNLLAKIFDARLAERFVREVLFPERKRPWS